jgi:DNA repair photolyase
MPDVLRALADADTPISILTKGTLLRRDLPLLAELNERVPVDLALSVAVFDGPLQEQVEPGVPTAAARLATVRAAREAGLDCGVFLMPVLPYLTDTVEHLDAALAQIAEAKPTYVLWTALHLKPGVREWYLDWIHRLHPEHEAAYRAMYAGGSYAPKAYRAWLAERIRPLIAKHGLRVGAVDSATGSTRSRATGIVQTTPRRVDTPTPTLF